MGGFVNNPLNNGSLWVNLLDLLAPVSGRCLSNFNKVLTTKIDFMQKKKK